MANWLILPVAALAAFAKMSEPASQSSQMSWEEQCASLHVIEGKVPEAFAECISHSGPAATESIRFELGFSRDQLNATLPALLGQLDSIWTTGRSVDLMWGFGDGGYLFANVGGMSQTVTIFELGLDERLKDVRFAWQNRPLKLDEALPKAKNLQAKLKQHGFEDVAQVAFTVTDEHGARQDRAARDWSNASAQLRNEAENISHMTLFTMRRRDSEVTVALENGRRAVREFSKGHPDPLPGYNRSFYEGAGGYEWLLHVDLFHPD